MSVFDSLKFKKLKREYYEKLKQDGFSDIEDEDGYITTHRSSHDFHQRIGFQSTLFRDQVTDYYSWAYHHALYSEFRTDIEAIIWIAHSKGLSSREITKLVDYSQSWIYNRLKQIRTYLEALPEYSE